MLWGGIFALGHAFSLYIHLRETADYELSESHQAIYSKIFEDYGFTKWHFMQLMSQARIRSFSAGEIVFEQGEPVDWLPFIIDGKAELVVRRDVCFNGKNAALVKKTDRERFFDAPTTYVGSLKSGDCAGEIWDRDYYSDATKAKMQAAHGDEEHRWFVDCVTKTEATFLEFPKRWLHDKIAENDTMRAAAGEMQVGADCSRPPPCAPGSLARAVLRMYPSLTSSAPPQVKELWRVRRALVQELSAVKEENAGLRASLDSENGANVERGGSSAVRK